MNAEILLVFLITGIGAGAVGWRALRRARSPAPVPAAPAVAATGLLWLLVGWRWLAGSWPVWWLPVPLVVTALAVPLTMADLWHRRLPDVLTLPAYPLLGLALLAVAWCGPGAGLVTRALIAGVVFGGAHLLVHALSPPSLGAGDVKLAGVLGAALGAVGWVAVFAGAVVAAIVTLLLAVRPRWRADVPHGPGLLVAAWVMTVFPGGGSEMVRWSVTK